MFFLPEVWIRLGDLRTRLGRLGARTPQGPPQGPPGGFYDVQQFDITGHLFLLVCLSAFAVELRGVAYPQVGTRLLPPVVSAGTILPLFVFSFCPSRDFGGKIFLISVAFF